jgi:spoIIIJ-associated protein
LGFGQKDAVVRVSKKDAAETKVEAVEVKAVKTEEKAELKAEIPVQEPTPVVEVVVDDTEEQEAEVSFEEAFDTDIDEETEEFDVAVAKADKKELYEAAEAKGRAFLAKIFDEMKLDVVIDVKENGGYLVFDLQGENLGILIGRRGDTLDSLQFLLNLVINDKNNAKVKGIIDIENYRAKREETLIGLGHKLAAKARKTGQKVVLEPMNPQERRIIHMALQNDKRVTTYSEGEEPYRKVVIEPVAGAEKPYYKKNYNKNYHNNKKRSYGKDAVKTTAQETETV